MDLIKRLLSINLEQIHLLQKRTTQLKGSCMHFWPWVAWHFRWPKRNQHQKWPHAVVFFWKHLCAFRSVIKRFWKRMTENSCHRPNQWFLQWFQKHIFSLFYNTAVKEKRGYRESRLLESINKMVLETKEQMQMSNMEASTQQLSEIHKRCKFST